MNFNVESVQSTFDQRDWFETDIVGLNATKIPDMQEAINTMVTNIQAKIGELQTIINKEKVFKGPEMKDTLQQYLEQVVTYCDNLISNLKRFNDKLTDVKKEWDATTSTKSTETIQ